MNEPTVVQIEITPPATAYGIKRPFLIPLLRKNKINKKVIA